MKLKTVSHLKMILFLDQNYNSKMLQDYSEPDSSEDLDDFDDDLDGEEDIDDLG